MYNGLVLVTQLYLFVIATQGLHLLHEQPGATKGKHSSKRDNDHT